MQLFLHGNQTASLTVVDLNIVRILNTREYEKKVIQVGTRDCETQVRLQCILISNNHFPVIDP